jgi:hypothetical protein
VKRNIAFIVCAKNCIQPRFSENVGKTSIARLLRNPKAKMERDLSTDGVEVIEIEKRVLVISNYLGFLDFNNWHDEASARTANL